MGTTMDGKSKKSEKKEKLISRLRTEVKIIEEQEKPPTYKGKVEAMITCCVCRTQIRIPIKKDILTDEFFEHEEYIIEHLVAPLMELEWTIVLGRYYCPDHNEVGVEAVKIFELAEKKKKAA